MPIRRSSRPKYQLNAAVPGTVGASGSVVICVVICKILASLLRILPIILATLLRILPVILTTLLRVLSIILTTLLPAVGTLLVRIRALSSALLARIRLVLRGLLTLSLVLAGSALRGLLALSLVLAGSALPVPWLPLLLCWLEVRAPEDDSLPTKIRLLVPHLRAKSRHLLLRHLVRRRHRLVRRRLVRLRRLRSELGRTGQKQGLFDLQLLLTGICISFLASFLRSGRSSGVANLGHELNSIRAIGRSKRKEPIRNFPGPNSSWRDQPRPAVAPFHLGR